MEKLEEYKQQTVAAMLAMTNSEGLPLVAEKEAWQLLKDLGDDTLLDGMDFNTPEETARFIMED